MTIKRMFNPLSFCSCCSNVLSDALQKFHITLNKSFYSFGKNVSKNKGYYILVPIFLTVLSLTGFQNLKYEDDPEYLFAPSNGAAKRERAIVEENFFMNFSYLFDPSRITRSGRFAKFIVTAKDGETMLRKLIWNDVEKLDNLVKNVAVKENKITYRYENLCAVKDGECFKNEVLALKDVISEVENGTFQIQYPINLDPFLIPHFFGGLQIDEDQVVTSAKAISLLYVIRTDNQDEIIRGKDWEKELLKIFETVEFDYIDAARFTSTTVEDELEKNTNSVKPFVAITLTIMILFSAFACVMGDWVRGKPMIGVIGVVTSVLSSFAAFGLLIYIGVPFIGINMAAPFLMLGIGIDDSFVMLAAWRRTRIQDPIEERLAQTYSEAAVSITITSLTDMISFFIGVITPFPSVQIFCIYTGTAVLITYIWHITLFGGCLAVAGNAEQNQKHSLLCVRVKSKSEAEIENCLYSAFCGGGINKSDPWNPRDNQDHLIMIFFREYIGKFLNIPAIKTFVICVFLVYLGGAIYGCMHVKEGLEKTRLSRYDSYSVHFYTLEDKYFRVYPYNVQVVITGNVTYSDPNTKSDILTLIKSFEELPYIDKDYTQSVIRYWYSFLEENADWLDFNITDEQSFINHLREVYVSDPSDVLNLDIKYNEDFSRILATRFIIQTHNLRDSNDDKSMMEELRTIANESKFNVTIFNPLFIFFDQFVLVRTLTIQAISLAAIIMMIVSFILIPNPWCSLWVAFSIFSIEVGVVGYMTMWGVNLDSISMINLIMCIGFSVDFSAHISYAYLTSKLEYSEDKVKDCLFTLGLPILQGGISTILGVIVLLFAPSYIFLTFFKIVFLVIFFGIMHGIFLLPVLLSLVGPGSRRKKSDLQSYSTNQLFINHSEFSANKNELNEHTAAQTDTTEKIILKSGTFLAQINPKIISNEKEINLRSSGKFSNEGSLEGMYFKREQPCHDDKKVIRKLAYPIKELYNNKGYVSDTEVGKTDAHIKSNHSNRKSNYSQHYEEPYQNNTRHNRDYQYSRHTSKHQRKPTRH